MASAPVSFSLSGVVPRAWHGPALIAYRLLLLAAVGVLVAWALSAVWAFTIDDAGISYAYAKHIAEGLGPVATPGGPRVEGYSNPLWVFLLVPFHWLGLSIPAVAKGLGTAAFVLALLAGSATVALADGRRASALGAGEAAFAAACAAYLELVVWVPAGLENALFVLALLGMVFLDARESEDGACLPLSGLAAFALSITRPEGVLYAAPLVLLKLVGAWRRREPPRQALGAALSFVALFCLYHAAHYLVFAELVPNTYYAKPVGRSWAKGYDYLATTVRESGLVYALPLSVLGLWGRPRLKLLLGWSVLAGAAFAVHAGGDWMPYGRFVSLFAPSVLALAALGVCRLGRIASWGARERLPRELVVLGLSLLGVGLWARQQAPRLAALRAKGWCHFCERVADTRRIERLAATAKLRTRSLVTHDYGGPSWLSSEAFAPIDFLGLCDHSVALLRNQRPKGGLHGDARLYQYFIHEQPAAPSWVLVPPNFWPGFDRSPEYRWDYYTLDPKLVPNARRDAFFVLHRGELVDFFPPVPSAGFRALGERWALVGQAVFADPDAAAERVGPGARILVLASIVPRARLRAGERVSLRAEAGGTHSESAALDLERGLPGLARAFDTGEPLALELALTLPRKPGPYRLSLLVSGGPRASAPVQIELGELAPDAPLPALARDLPRFPAELPAPRAPELVRLRAAERASLEAARVAGRARGTDAALGRELTAVGAALEARGDAQQAYLAYVWATQVDARAWEDLAEPVFRLRPRGDDEHTMELSLLRRFYASGSAPRLGDLVAFYLSRQRWPEARYFLERWPSAEADPLALTLREALGRAEASPGEPAPEDATALAPVAVDPLEGALDFEADALDGWIGASGVFRAGARERHGLPGLRGEHGDGVLSSMESGKRARGTLLSPEFLLAGHTLSTLVGGGSDKSGAGVELLVDDAPVMTASGNDSDNLLPVFWDVSAFAGKRARLRLFDRSKRSYVLLDHVLLWR